MIRQWYEGGPYEIVLIFDIIESKTLRRENCLNVHFSPLSGPKTTIQPALKNKLKTSANAGVFRFKPLDNYSRFL